MDEYKELCIPPLKSSFDLYDELCPNVQCSFLDSLKSRILNFNISSENYENEAFSIYSIIRALMKAALKENENISFVAEEIINLREEILQNFYFTENFDFSQIQSELISIFFTFLTIFENDPKLNIIPPFIQNLPDFYYDSNTILIHILHILYLIVQNSNTDLETLRETAHILYSISYKFLYNDNEQVNMELIKSNILIHVVAQKIIILLLELIDILYNIIQQDKNSFNLYSKNIFPIFLELFHVSHHQDEFFFFDRMCKALSSLFIKILPFQRHLIPAILNVGYLITKDKISISGGVKLACLKLLNFISENDNNYDFFSHMLISQLISIQNNSLSIVFNNEDLDDFQILLFQIIFKKIFLMENAERKPYFDLLFIGFINEIDDFTFKVKTEIFNVILEFLEKVEVKDIPFGLSNIHLCELISVILNFSVEIDINQIKCETFYILIDYYSSNFTNPILDGVEGFLNQEIYSLLEQECLTFQNLNDFMDNYEENNLEIPLVQNNIEDIKKIHNVLESINNKNKTGLNYKEFRKELPMPNHFLQKKILISKDQMEIFFGQPWHTILK